MFVHKLNKKVTIQTLKLIIVIIPFSLLLCNFSYSVSKKKKVMASYISEKASRNPYSFGGKNFVAPKNEKDTFTFEDKEVTWSAVIRGGLGKYNFKDYEVKWYEPGGELFSTTYPKSVFMDCQGVKSALSINESTMNNKAGIWKVEVVYENMVIDEKYFYLGPDKNKVIDQDKINKLNALISGDTPSLIDEDDRSGIYQRLSTDIFDKKIDVKKAKNLVDATFDTGSGDAIPAYDGNVTLVAQDSKKIFYNLQFKLFYGMSSPKIIVYWITPDKRLYALNRTSFLPGGKASFYLRGNDITAEMKQGIWTVFTFVGKSKIRENKFKFENRDKVVQVLAKIAEKVDKPKAEKAVKSKNRTTWDLKKRMSKAQLLEVWGAPDRKIQLSENSSLWLYWGEGSGDTTGSDFHTAQGNLLGAVVHIVLGAAFDAMLEQGHVFGVYFIDSFIEDWRVKTSVTRARLQELDAKHFQERFFGIPLEKKLK